jgi:hypothetical protein
MSDSIAIGVAYRDQDIIGASKIYSAGELGYTASAQGVVTQGSTNGKSTDVTLNKPAGQIVMNNAALSGNQTATFQLSNNVISSNDIVIVNVAAGATHGAYNVWVSSIGAGECHISITKITTGSLSEAVVLNFCIIHCL